MLFQVDGISSSSISGDMSEQNFTATPEAHSLRCFLSDIRTRQRIVVAVALLFMLSIPRLWGAGVTIITHGFNGNVTDWIIPMAQRIPEYDLFPGTNFSCYEMVVYDDYSVSISRIGGVSPLAADSGEMIIKLDWSALSVDLFTSTSDIAVSVVPSLISTTFIPELAGRALAEFPIHLIGHSRGGSVVTEMARLLGSQGIWVDQVTTLDPHPVGAYGDAEVNLYLNVLFADNYWQTNPGFTCPNGESVFGAYNRYFANLQNGYSCNHSDVHLWYHGTVDWFRTPTTDTQATVTSSERQSWWTAYEAQGLRAGFNWTLIAGGNRLSTDEPAGAGNGQISDGMNQVWDFGGGVSGNRYSLPANNGAWPNVIKANIVGSNSVPRSNAVSLKYFYQYAQSSVPTATVQLFLDRDANPYNGNSGQVFQFTETGTGTNFMRSRTVSFNATNPAGQYYVYAKVTGAARVRYLHAPEKLTITPPPDTTKPSVSITNPASARTYTNAQTITVAASASDNVGVERVEFYDGFTLRGTDTSIGYTYDWSFTAADNGTHVWTARAYDAAGNVSTSSPVTLTVGIDVTPPTVAISSPSNGANVAISTVTVSGTATDPGSPSSGLNSIEVRVNGGGWQTASGTANWSRSVSLLPCSNTIDARSLDKAGNYSSIVSIGVTHTPPNTIPNTPFNVSPTNGETTVSITPTLQSSTFVDSDCTSDTHAASQWQVLNSSGAIVVADSGTSIVNKISWNVPPGKVNFGSNYQWRVRYQDSRNGWSGYSTPTSFFTIGPLLTGFKQGTNLVLKWPTNAVGFTLQWATNLPATNWSNATPSPVVVNGQYTVTNNATNRMRIYRLKK
jgi:hypothetical protein